MERRAFLATSLASVASLSLASRQAEAAEQTNLENVIFTETEPGHWKGKEKTHAPVVSVNGDKLSVATPHPMTEAHFIVSHSVVLKGGQFLNRKTFTWKDSPISEYMLPAGYKGEVVVTSTCNQHDWWVTRITV